MEEQVVSIFSCTPRAGRDSWVRPYELADLGRYETEMLEFIRTKHGAILETIASTQKLEADTADKLAAALDAFAEVFQPSTGSAAA
jgi:F-type H+-transporting ATPase subunit alpha